MKSFENTRHTLPERFCGGDSRRRSATQVYGPLPLPLPYQDDQQSRDGCIGTDFGFEVPGQSSNGL